MENMNGYQMISYWSDIKELSKNEDGFTIIFGKYNHKNENLNQAKYCVGVHWDNFPISRNILSPICLDFDTSNIVLSGLATKAINNNEIILLKTIIKAVEKLNS